MNRTFTQRRKARRQARDLSRAIREASPSMRQELIAAASRDVNR